jgi:hypothetical protein
VPLVRRVPGLPLGERGPITLERFVVKIENAGIAAAMTAILQLGPHGRLRLRVVAGSDSGHGEWRRIKAGSGQYKLIGHAVLRACSAAGMPRATCVT